MSNKQEQQNGRISSTSNTDSTVHRGAERPRNPSLGDDNICRDFVWGICSKGAQCRYRHELSYEVMKKILKFCHDYQNKAGCTRPGCTYLHASSDEETLFVTTGQIPRILRERYAAMSANSSCSSFVSQIMMQRPPPPPQNIPEAGAPPPPNIPAVGAPPPQIIPTVGVPTPPNIPTVGAPPPPPPASLIDSLLMPPPPPPPTNVSAAPLQSSPPNLTAPPPTNTTLPSQSAGPPKAELPLFDASKPPPPLPSVATVPKPALKRPADSSSEAGPSKLLKEEVSKLENSSCENCVNRELRVHVFQKIEKQLEGEIKYESYKMQKKTEMFDNARLLLKSAVSPDLFRILDDYVQCSSPPVSPQASDRLSPFNQNSSLVTGSSSSLQREILRNMMELSRNFDDVGPRAGLLGNDPDVTIQSILEVMCSAKRKSEERPMENGISPVSEKSSSPGTTSGYSNDVSAPLRSLPIAVTASGTPLAPSGALQNSHSPNAALALSVSLAHSQSVTHYTQSGSLTNPQKCTTTSTTQSSSQSATQQHAVANKQNVAQVKNMIQMQGARPPIVSHPSNIMHPRSVIPPQGAAVSPVVTHPQSIVRPQAAVHNSNVMRPHGFTQPPGIPPHLPLTHMVPHQQLSQPPYMAHPQHGVLPHNGTPPQNGALSKNGALQQNGAHPQKGPHLQNGPHTQNGPHLLNEPPPNNGPHSHNVAQPQNVAHPQNVPPAAVPPAAYMPYQAAVPPPQRAHYPQCPPTPNKVVNATNAMSTRGVRPGSATTSPHNGCVNGGLRFPHYYPAYP